MDFDPKEIIFPIRAAMDLAEQRAERCKHLYEVVKPQLSEGPAGGDLGEGDRVDPSAPDPASSGQDTPVLDIPEYPIDTRGHGDVVGGTGIRKYRGSTRPPGITSSAWRQSTPDRKKRLIE